MKRLRVVIFLCVLTKTYSLCTSGYSIKCDSIADVAQYEDGELWENLIIGDESNNVPNETLKFAFLNKFPHVQDLTIVSRLNEIEAGAFGGLENLLVLKLYHNVIKTLSFGEFIPLDQLVRADFQHNQIEIISDADLSTSAYLVSIDLSHNKLKKLDHNSFTRESTKRVTITHNKISEFGQAPIFSENLQYLNMDNNEVYYIQDEIFNLANLKELILSNNKFTKFSFSFRLPNLKKLDLSHNNINTVASGVFDNMTKLTHIYLNHNQIKQLPLDIFVVYTTQKANISALHLDNNKMENLQFLVLNNWPAIREISIAQNPWTCMCLDQLLLFFELSGVKITQSDKKYFFENGNLPTCVVVNSDWSNGECRLLEYEVYAHKEFFDAIKPVKF